MRPGGLCFAAVGSGPARIGEAGSQLLLWQRIKQHRYWLSAALGLVFLFLAFRDVRLGQTLEVLRRADPWPLAACLPLYGVVLALRAWRWKYLLRPVKEVPAPRLYTIVAIGYMGNNLLPARIGDLLRAWLIGNREDISKTASLATILLERLFDGTATLLLVALLLPFLVLPAWVLQGLAGIAVVALALALVAALVARESGRALRLFRRAVTWVPGRWRVRLIGLMAHFLEGFRVLRRPRDIAMAVLASIGIWLVVAAIYYAVMLSLGAGASPWAALLVSALVNVSAVVPSAPGNLGTFELAAMIGYGLVNVSPELAAGLTVATHAALFLSGTAIGLICLWRENLSLALLGKDRLPAEPADGPGWPSPAPITAINPAVERTD